MRTDSDIPETPSTPPSPNDAADESAQVDIPRFASPTIGKHAARPQHLDALSNAGEHAFSSAAITTSAHDDAVAFTDLSAPDSSCAGSAEFPGGSPADADSPDGSLAKANATDGSPAETGSSLDADSSDGSTTETGSSLDADSSDGSTTEGELSLETEPPSPEDIVPERTHRPLPNLNWLAWVLLALVVAAQLFYITDVFQSREGYHSDESWSYGFANSHYDGYLYRDAEENHITEADWSNAIATEGFYSWDSCETIHDYMTVQEGEQFDYGSVLYNQKYDLSPPLHSMILNTICSFFPDQFSWWFAYSINFASFIVLQLLLFLMGKRLFKSPWPALLVVVCFGFCTGALNCFVYLRPYALLACLTLAFVALHLRLIDHDFEHCTPTIVGLGFVTFLAAFTNVYFLLFALVMALGTCVYLVCRRRYGALLRYGFAVLAGTAAMLLVCSSMFTALTYQSSAYGHANDLLYYFMYCSSILLKETIGVDVFTDYLVRFTWIGFITLLVVVVLIGFFFLTRKAKWFKPFWHAVGGFFVRIGRKFRRTAHEPHSRFWFLLIVNLAVLACVVLVAKSSNVDGMKEMTDRYLFYLMPYVWITLVWVVWWILRRIPFKPDWMKTAFASALLVVCGGGLLSLNLVNTGCNYLFPRSSDYTQTDTEVLAGSDIVLITTYDWQLTYWANVLQYGNNYIAMLADESENYTDALEAIPDDGTPVYAVIEVYRFANTQEALLGTMNGSSISISGATKLGTGFTVSEYLTYLRSISWVDQMTYVGTENGFDGTVEIFRLR